MLKALYVYCKETKDTKRLLEDENFSRGSIFHVKGEYLRCKAFGTKNQGSQMMLFRPLTISNFCSVIFCYLDNFSEKLSRKADSTNPYTKIMEEDFQCIELPLRRLFSLIDQGKVSENLR